MLNRMLITEPLLPPTPRGCAPNSNNSKGTKRRARGEERRPLGGETPISVQHHHRGEQREHTPGILKMKQWPVLQTGRGFLHWIYNFSYL